MRYQENPKYDLSLIIPGNREMFMARTIEDALEHREAKTEIIAVLDGGVWANPPIKHHPDVRVVYLPTVHGQRGATNMGARLSKSKYVAKSDAHCMFGQGWDRIMLEAFAKVGDDVTMVPIMRNLHAFNWVCKDCNWTKYQGPTPEDCGNCHKKDTVFRDMVWQPRRGTYSTSYSFDQEPHFQYLQEYKQRVEYRNGVVVGYQLSFEEPNLSPSVVSFLTDLARSHQFTSCSDTLWFGENVSANAVSFSTVDHSGSIRAVKIHGIGDKLEVRRVATTSVPTEMVQDLDALSTPFGEWTDKPGISYSMGKLFLSEISAPTIPTRVNASNPVPASAHIVGSDVVDELHRILGGKFMYSEKTNRFHNGSVVLTPVYDNSMTYSMSLQGSFFMTTRENYWRLKLSDERVGSWGNQGIEVACKTWLSGGRVLVNHNTWYAHLFRTQGGDFSFPYHNSDKEIQKTKQRVWEHFFDGSFKHQKHPVSWLIERFWPVPGWSPEALAKLKEKESGQVRAQ